MRTRLLSSTSLLGAGFETIRELSPRQELLLDATINDGRGRQDVSLPIVVRNVRNVSGDRWRVGAEFGNARPRAINALVEYCMVEPALTPGSACFVPADVDHVGALEAVLQSWSPCLRLLSAALCGSSVEPSPPPSRVMARSSPGWYRRPPS